MSKAQGLTPEQLRVIRDMVRSALPDIVAVYVFGSVQSGHARRGSDVDLALLGREKVDPSVHAGLREKLESDLRRDVDLIDLRRASTVMRSQVVSTGGVLCDDGSGSRELFEDYCYSAYARLNEERREILDRIRSEGRIHGG